MRIMKSKLSEDMKNQLGISIYVEFFPDNYHFYAKVQTSNGDVSLWQSSSAACQHIKASKPLKQNQLIKKNREKGDQIFSLLSHYLFTTTVYC